MDGYLAEIDGGFVPDGQKQHEIIQRSKGRIHALMDLVVDFYHGRIAVESELDKGPIFTVWLPGQGSGAGEEGPGIRKDK